MDTRFQGFLTPHVTIPVSQVIAFEHQLASLSLLQLYIKLPENGPTTDSVRR